MPSSNSNFLSSRVINYILWFLNSKTFSIYILHLPEYFVSKFLNMGGSYEEKGRRSLETAGQSRSLK